MTFCGTLEEWARAAGRQSVSDVLWSGWSVVRVGRLEVDSVWIRCGRGRGVSRWIRVRPFEVPSFHVWLLHASQQHRRWNRVTLARHAATFLEQTTRDAHDSYPG